MNLLCILCLTDQTVWPPHSLSSSIVLLSHHHNWLRQMTTQPKAKPRALNGFHCQRTNKLN